MTKSQTECLKTKTHYGHQQEEAAITTALSYEIINRFENKGICSSKGDAGRHFVFREDLIFWEVVAVLRRIVRQRRICLVQIGLKRYNGESNYRFFR